jgi:diguanylate cyclase (GGDEF)-like protein
LQPCLHQALEHPAWALAAHDETFLLSYVRDQLVDPAAFIREVERIHPTLEASEDELLLKDGRALRRSVPSTKADFAARLWIFTDVTDARYAHVDALCGIPNRRAYAAQFPRFVEAADDGWVRAIGVMDIDNFKAYNDCYGHAAGDVVLRKIGSLLRRQMANPDDLAFRIGGEEFVVASRCQDDQGALAFFESLRAGIEDLQLPHEGNKPHNVVTTSIGLATFANRARRPGSSMMPMRHSIAPNMAVETGSCWQHKGASTRAHPARDCVFQKGKPLPLPSRIQVTNMPARLMLRRRLSAAPRPIPKAPIEESSVGASAARELSTMLAQKSHG